MRKTMLVVAVLLAWGIAVSCTQKKLITAKEFTIGIVQKEIRKGMSQTQVVEALGSPNIVTKDEDSNESWVYDKIASEASYKRKGSFWTLILFGGSSESGSSVYSQKTLTVIIKFDEAGKVNKVAYHASKF